MEVFLSPELSYWADLQTRLSVGYEAGEGGRTLPCRCRRSITVGVLFYAIIPGERYNGGFVAFGRRDLSLISDSLDKTVVVVQR